MRRKSSRTPKHPDLFDYAGIPLKRVYRPAKQVPGYPFNGPLQS